MDGQSDVKVHRLHVRKVLTLKREHKLYPNLKKCIFAAYEIPLLGCIVGKAIADWTMPTEAKGLRKFLVLAAYLHK